MPRRRGCVEKSVCTSARPPGFGCSGRWACEVSEDQPVVVGGAQAVGNGTHVGAFTKVTSDVTDIATGEVEGSFRMTAAR